MAHVASEEMKQKIMAMGWPAKDIGILWFGLGGEPGMVSSAIAERLQIPQSVVMDALVQNEFVPPGTTMS